MQQLTKACRNGRAFDTQVGERSRSTQQLLGLNPGRRRRLRGQVEQRLQVIGVELGDVDRAGDLVSDLLVGQLREDLLRGRQDVRRCVGISAGRRGHLRDSTQGARQLLDINTGLCQGLGGCRQLLHVVGRCRCHRTNGGCQAHHLPVGRLGDGLNLLERVLEVDDVPHQTAEGRAQLIQRAVDHRIAHERVDGSTNLPQQADVAQHVLLEGFLLAGVLELRTF